MGTITFFQRLNDCGKPLHKMSKKELEELNNTTAYDDKPYIESFISSYKKEEVYRNYYYGIFDAYIAWNNYMHWYNNYRPHSSLKNLSPAQFRSLYSYSFCT